MTTVDEKQIIERIQKGENELFGLLLVNYSNQIFGLIVRMVGNREDAEELTQDVFLKVFRALPDYRGESSFSTWLYRIAYNCAVSKIRKKRQRFYLGGTLWKRLAGEVPEEEFTPQEDQLVSLEQALRRLPPEEALMILMFYWEKKSVQELAKITGLSAGNVKVRLHRIREKLKKWILNKK